MRYLIILLMCLALSGCMAMVGAGVGGLAVHEYDKYKQNQAMWDAAYKEYVKNQEAQGKVPLSFYDWRKLQ